MRKEELLLEQWKAASELHRQENELIWHRFNYFVAINGGLLSTLGILLFSDVPINPNPYVGSAELVICLFGTLASSLWAITQRRGQLYHRFRIAQARQAEKLLLIEDERVLTLYEKDIEDQELTPIRGPEKWSTQTIVLYVSIILSVFWFGLFLLLLISQLTK